MDADDIVDYKNLYYKSGENEEFKLGNYGSLTSIYLKLTRGKTSIIKPV